MRKFDKKQAEKPNNTLKVIFTGGIKPKNVLGADIQVKGDEVKLPDLPVSPKMRKILEDQLKAKKK